MVSDWKNSSNSNLMPASVEFESIPSNIITSSLYESCSNLIPKVFLGVKKSSNIIVSLTVFSDTRFSMTEKVEKASTISEPDSSKVILLFF